MSLDLRDGGRVTTNSPPASISAPPSPGPAYPFGNPSPSTCAISPPDACGGHGVREGCACKCHPGYATDFTNFMDIQWCIPTSANSGGNSTTGSRDQDLIDKGGIVYDERGYGSGSPSAGNPVSNMLRTDAGTAVFVVTLVLTIGCCVFWCRRKCGHRWPIKLCCGHNTCCCIDYGEKRRQAKLRRQENSSNSDEERGWGRWREERHRSRDAHSDDSASVVVMRSQRRGKKSRDRDGEEFGVHGQGRARAYAVGGAQHQLEVGQGALPAGVLGLNPGAAGVTLITNQMAAMLAASMMQQQQPLQLPAPLQPQPQLQLQPYQAASPFLPQHMYQMALGQTGMLQGLDHHHHHHRPRRSMSTGFDPVAEGNSSRHVHSRRQEQARNRDGGGGGGGSSSSRRYRRGDAGGPAGPEVTPRGGHHHHHHNHHHSPQRGANKEAPSPSHTHGSRSHPGHPSAPAAAAVGQWKKYDNPLIDPLVARQRQVRSAPPVKSGGMGGAGSQGVRLQAPQPAARTARAGTR